MIHLKSVVLTINLAFFLSTLAACAAPGRVPATPTSPVAPTPAPPTATSVPPTRLAPTATQVPPTRVAPTATPLLPTATPTEENYERVDPKEFDFDLVGSLMVRHYLDGRGDVLQGFVQAFTLHGKPIALSTDEIVMEGNDQFIITKDYGAIKVTHDDGFNFWLKPSQKAKLKELVK